METATEALPSQSNGTPLRLIRLLRGPAVEPTYILTRWLFLRALGLIYLIAFASLGSQITGLIGSNGISPVATYLQEVQRALGSQAYTRLPTLVWLNSSDTFLVVLCGAGILLSVLVLFDVLTLPALAILWVLYLSLVYAGQNFLTYQWDILLLETGFLAIFLAPIQPLPGWSRQGRPSRVVIWLFRLLLFRLILESGLVKLTSGDPTWRSLTATTYHYWTQPLPSPLAWYMNLLPLPFHQFEVLFTFFVELMVPFLIFGPRRVRFAAAGLITFHQTLILLTGNYTFFNFLTISLCLFLLDDAFLKRFLPRRLTNRLLALPSMSILPRWRHILSLGLGILIGLLSVAQFGDEFLGGLPLLSDLAQTVGPLFLVNSYGLFATMTTSRPEIIVEGSNDGQTWLAYEFKYKAGDPHRAPAWVEPFQPRLDWQMWFAALEGSPYVEGWFPNFMRRLLQGSPNVLALLDRNPFPDTPPKYVRAEFYDYHFTDAAQCAATGDWWARQLTGEFFPQVSLNDFNQTAPGTSG